MSLPRLIATDLDGTLVGRDGTISRRTAKVLAQVAAAGSIVVLATGRPLRWLPVAYEQLDTEYLTICANGAVTYDPATDAVLDSRPLPPDLLADLATKLATAIPGMTFAAEIDDGRRMVHEPAYPVAFDDGSRELPLSEVVARPAVKLLGSATDRRAEELAALVLTAVAHRIEATHSSSIGMVEMSASGVTKGAMLSALAGRLGIDAADVLAFGDMPNDVTMLRWAGRAVVVANAHPAARELADAVTLSNVDDGVAEYLERLL